VWKTAASGHDLRGQGFLKPVSGSHLSGTLHKAEHGLGHSQDSEKVGIKKLLRFFDRRLFERADEGVPSIVDQGVDSSGPVKNSSYTRIDRLSVANIDVDQHDILQSFLGSAIPPHGPEDSETVAGAAAAEQAFGTLMSFVKGCQDAGRLPSGDLRQMALLAWTMVHGVAKLAITRRLPFSSSAEVLKFAEFVIDQSLPAGR
jgi:hypothetical protein